MRAWNSIVGKGFVNTNLPDPSNLIDYITLPYDLAESIMPFGLKNQIKLFPDKFVFDIYRILDVELK